MATAGAGRRLAGHGPNRLPGVRGRGPVARFIARFHNVPMSCRLCDIRSFHNTLPKWAAARGTRVVCMHGLIATAAKFAVTCPAPLQALPGTAPVPIADGLLTVGVGVALFAVIEIKTQIRLGLTP